MTTEEGFISGSRSDQPVRLTLGDKSVMSLPGTDLYAVNASDGTCLGFDIGSPRQSVAVRGSQAHYLISLYATSNWSAEAASQR